MKAIKISKPYIIESVELNEPCLTNSGDIKIRTKRVGICGSDMHIYHGKDNLASYPIILGHEITGEVLEVASNVKKVKKGDRVVIEPINTCGECYACQNNRPNVCKTLSVLGVHEDGGMKEYIVLSENKVHKINNDIDWDEAVLTEPYTIGAQALWRGEVTGSQTLLIQGAGSIGIILLKLAKISCPKVTIIMSDIVDQKLRFAKENGAHHVINPLKTNMGEKINNLTKNEGVNTVIDAVGTSETFESSIELASIAGSVVTLGFSIKKSSVILNQITKKELTIVGSRLQTFQFPYIINLLNRKVLTSNNLISHKFPKDKIKEAFEFIESNPEKARKVIIDFDI